MASDSLAELRSTISAHLGRFWRPDPEAPAIDYSGPRDSPRYGVAMPAPANALREEVAAEIADRLRQDRRSISDLLPRRSGGDPTPGEEALDAAEAASLPLGARLKPRGIFEDDWSALPSKQRPWPVILLHGTCDTKGIWQILGARLRSDGWAVFAPDYGTRATGPIPNSANQIDSYISAVRAVTGAQQVVIIGHSQGGLIARYWMRVHERGDWVRHLVCLASPNHGTTHGGIVSRLLRTHRQEAVMKSIIDGWFGPAGRQQIVGSSILDTVNAGGDLEEGVTYTCVATRSDAVVVPPETCFLGTEDVPDGTVRNVYVQDFDRRSVVLHEDMPMDKRVGAIVRTILDQL